MKYWIDGETYDISYTMYSDRVELNDDYFRINECFDANGNLIVPVDVYDARIARMAKWAASEFCDDDEMQIDIRDGVTIDFIEDEE